MRLIQKIASSGALLLKAKFFRRRIPLFVGWELTNRCNLRCRYCDAWKEESPELPTNTILSVVDELKSLGVKFISFTGGEPLLRQDLSVIIDYCKNKSIHVSVNSNGSDIKTKFPCIKNADFITLSLDGPEEIHDYTRGAGSYNKVLEAARIIKDAGIPLNFASTLTKINFEQIDFLVNKAFESGASITFQPALANVLYSGKNNELCLSESSYKQAIQCIINYKKGPLGSVITNSFAALKHLFYWPNNREIRCASGIISCRIKSNGDVCLCNRSYGKFGKQNNIEGGFKKAFYALPQLSCTQCWCAQRVEANLLFRLEPDVILNNLAMLARGGYGG